MKLAITFQTRGDVHISRTPRRSFGGFCRCVRGGWLRRETHGFFPLIWWEEFILESALNTRMWHVVLSGRTGSCFTAMEWLLIHFWSSVLLRKDTHVYIIVVPLPQRHLIDWLGGHDLRPFHLIGMPCLLFPQVYVRVSVRTVMPPAFNLALQKVRAAWNLPVRPRNGTKLPKPATLWMPWTCLR